MQSRSSSQGDVWQVWCQGDCTDLYVKRCLKHMLLTCQLSAVRYVHVIESRLMVSVSM